MARSTPAAGFAAFIDLQTLVTHNHTIICGSLREGLTNNPRAHHAQASCHKKDCVCREALAEIITPRSFRFLFTARCPIFIGNFRDCFSLIYSKLFFCKSCDGFNQIKNYTMSNSAHYDNLANYKNYTGHQVNAIQISLTQGFPVVTLSLTLTYRACSFQL